MALGAACLSKKLIERSQYLQRYLSKERRQSSGSGYSCTRYAYSYAVLAFLEAIPIWRENEAGHSPSVS